jgi:hypothetical protein
MMLAGHMLRSLGRGLGRYCLSAISCRFRVAGRLINPARRSLRLLRGSLGLACSRLSARGCLIGALRRVGGALRGIGLA